MSLYRKQLPQLGKQLFISDGGLETTLIFHEGVELPLFASFDLLKDAKGCDILRNYYRRYGKLALAHKRGFILESPTWRASRDWGQRMGYNPKQLKQMNEQAISLMEEIRAEFATGQQPFVISGCIGPRTDAYRSSTINATDAELYHSEQIGVLAATAADMISAFTLTSINEAIGITRAAQSCQIPVCISFTLETDACLPSGESLEAAISAVDEATDAYPVYYMVNCAHATHFEKQLPGGEALLRLRGIRANASRCSHAELDEAAELDAGNPAEFGEDYLRLYRQVPNLTVVGGCCGTDHRHVISICNSLAAVA